MASRRPLKTNRRRSVLPGGLTLLTERMDHLRSATVGIWLKKGSRHEEEDESGISHFIEHLVFKGTHSRSCRDIARTIDRTGGLTGASTSKEFATFSVKVMDEHLPVALDLLTDILTNPAFDPAEIENERRVIYEEIKLTQDNPEDLIGEAYYQSYFKNHPLGRSILGTNETVAQFGRDRIVEFFQSSYIPSNIIVSAAGRVDHDALVDYFTKKFPGEGSSASRRHLTQEGPSPTPNIERLYVSKSNLEQMHINIGFPGLHRSHGDRFPLFLLNDILGGSMSSRLFQNIREKWGLAYSIFSFATSFCDTGTVTIYTGVDPMEARRTIDLIIQELSSVCRSDVDAQELEDSKTHLKGSLMLGLESSSARMANLAINEMYFGRQFTPDDILESINGVALDDVISMARRIFDTDKISLVVLGGAPTFDVDSLDLRMMRSTPVNQDRTDSSVS